MSRSHTLSHPFPRDRVVRPRASRVPRASHPGDRPRSIAAPRPPPPPVETHPSTDRVVSPRLRHRRHATSSMRRTRATMVFNHLQYEPPPRARFPARARVDPPARRFARERTRVARGRHCARATTHTMQVRRSIELARAVRSRARRGAGARAARARKRTPARARAEGCELKRHRRARGAWRRERETDARENVA